MIDPIAVVLADDHLMVREGLSAWFATQPDLRLVAHVSDADQAVAAVREHSPRVVILDIDMPGRDCFEAARSIMQTSPATQVIFLSALVGDQFIEQVLSTRAAGYILKGGPLSELSKAIQRAVRGEVTFSDCITERIVIDDRGPRLASRPKSRLATLTRRELEVLRHVARGLTQKEIAEVMGVSGETVHSHTKRLMSKLDVRNRVQLAVLAVSEGLVRTPQMRDDAPLPAPSLNNPSQFR